MSGISFGGGGVVGGAYEPIAKLISVTTPIANGSQADWVELYSCSGQGFIDLAIFSGGGTNYYAMFELYIDDVLKIKASNLNYYNPAGGMAEAKYIYSKEANTRLIYTPSAVITSITEQYTEGMDVSTSVLQIGCPMYFAKKVSIRGKCQTSGYSSGISVLIKGGLKK